MEISFNRKLLLYDSDGIVTGGNKFNDTLLSKTGTFLSFTLLFNGMRGLFPVGLPKITSEFVLMTSPGEIGISEGKKND